jgi:hypothetical protein
MQCKNGPAQQQQQINVMKNVVTMKNQNLINLLIKGR